MGVIGGWSPQSVPRRGELKFCAISFDSVPKSDDGCNKRTTPLQKIQILSLHQDYLLKETIKIKIQTKVKTLKLTLDQNFEDNSWFLFEDN